MYLIPQPRREERGTGIYRLSWKGSIRLDGCREQALGYAALLQQEIREDLGFDWQITTVTGRSGKDGLPHPGPHETARNSVCGFFFEKKRI